MIMDEEAAVARRRITTLRWAVPCVLAALPLAWRLAVEPWARGRIGAGLPSAVELVLAIVVGPALAFGVLTLVSRRLEALDQARVETQAMERRLAGMVATSADAILALNPDGHIAFWNAGAEHLFGCTAEEALAQPLAELLGGGPAAEVEAAWILETTLRDGHLRRHETLCRRVGNGPLDIELTATRLGDGAGETTGLTVVVRDVTARRHRENDVRQASERLYLQLADRNRELAGKVEELARANVELQRLDQTRSEFVSQVSHQIRAPLTNIGGAVQRMQADCAAAVPTCRRMFTIIDQQITRLDRLVQEVLSASRLESGEISLQIEPISVLPIVRQVAEQTRVRASGRHIRIADKPGLPLVYADRDAVTEVLANLLDNADKYSGPDDVIHIELRADDAEVTVAVRDAGPGLPPEDLERVFGKFYRTDSTDAQAAYGYGLGLYVCRRLLEAQRGRIWAENHTAGGAVFSFSLPAWRLDHG